MKDYLNRLKYTVEENIKKNKFILLGFLIVWVALIVFTLNKYETTLGKSVLGNESYHRDVINLDKNTVIKQVLPLEEDSDSISILFATYARKNKGSVYIKIDGINSKKNYFEGKFIVDEILDNIYLTVKTTEKINHIREKGIVVTLSSDSNEDEAVAVYRSLSKEIEGGSLTINGEAIEDSDLSIKYLYDDELLKGFSDAVITWSIIGLTLVAVLLLLFDPKPEVMFAFMIFVLGLIMMIIINPSSPPDELSHYEVALGVSNKMMFIKDYNTIDSVYLKYGYMYGHYNISPGYVRFVNEFGKPLKLTGVMQPISRSIDDIFQMQYIPNALGLTIGRLLKTNMITTFYMGRLTGLIFYVACVYLAIKKTCSFKFLFGMIASMPMFIQIGISITYDAYINALSILTIAFFIKWYFTDEKIDIREYIFVFLINFGLAPAKILYSFFSFLFFFVPSSRYGGKKQKFIMSLILAAPGAYQLFDIMRGPIIFFVHSVLSMNIRDNLLDASVVIRNNANMLVAPLKDIYTYSYMIHNPIETLMIFLRTIRYKIKFWFYGSIGRSLSGDSLILPLRLVHIMIAIIFASAFVKTEYTFSVGMKVMLIGLCIIVGLYALVGMFVSWTDSNQEIIEDYGGVIIEGIQGRYFSPLLPYFFPVFTNKKIALPKESEKYIILAYLLLFFEVVIYVMSYTFVN